MKELTNELDRLKIKYSMTDNYLEVTGFFSSLKQRNDFLNIVNSYSWLSHTVHNGNLLIC